MNTRYQQKISRVLDHVYANLDGDLNLDKLADVAHLSRFHWHRIYSAQTGESIMATVRRLRLQRAADRLANSDTPIDEIAQTAGFGGTEAFNRAFKSSFELPPAKYRAAGSHAKYKEAIRSADARAFPVELVRLDNLDVYSVAHRGSYLQIDQAMGALFAAIAEQQLVTVEGSMLAIFYDDPELVESDKLRSAACVDVGASVVNEGDCQLPVERLSIATGQYAKLAYRGPYADMHGAYNWLYGTWLPESGFDPSEAPAFERYLNSPDQVSATELRTDIYLPIQGA